MIDPPTATARPAAPPAWLQGVAIVALAIVPMLPSLSSEVLWDDPVFITEHPLLPDVAHGLRRIWTGEYIHDYYPLTHTVLWLEYRLWGPSILGFRVANLLWHAAGALALWGAGRAWRVPAAWFVAALYAVHPANVDVAAWASQHKATVSMVFFSGALWAYAESLRQADAGRRWLAYGLALACHAASLLSKTGSVGLPVLLILLQVWWARRGPEQRREFGAFGDLGLLPAVRHAVARTVPFFVLSLVLGALAIWFMQSRVNLGSGMDWGGPVARFLHGSWAYGFYWYRCALPIRLAPVYPVWDINPANPLHWVSVALIAAAVTMGVVTRHHGGDLVLAAMTWMAVLLAPFLCIVDQSFSTRSSVADRYLQMAMLAPVALAANAIRTWASRTGHPAWLRPAAAGVLLLLAAVSFDHSRTYRSDHAMWARGVVVQPDAHYAHEALSLALLRQGDIDGALRHARRAVEIAPWFGHNHFVLAVVQMRRHEHVQAVAALEAAIAREPHHAGAWQALGYCRMALDEPEAAADAFARASSYTQTAEQSGRELARLHLQLGRSAEAGPLLVGILRRNPRDTEAYLSLVIERIAARDARRAAVLLERLDALSATELQGQRIRAWAMALRDDTLASTLAALEALEARHPDDRPLRADVAIARRLAHGD